MSGREPVETINLSRYGNDPLPWSRARAALAGETPSMDVTCFLGTVGPDGRPHSAGFGAGWHDGDLYFTSGPGTRKSRDLAAHPACTISGHFKGIDVVLEGDAARVVDPAVLEELARTYREGGWPVEVEGDAFTAPYSAPSAGPPPWHLYRFTCRAATGVATAEPHGATRWRFAV